MQSGLYFSEGDVWLCYLGKNIGREQNGAGKKLLRPVVIVKKYNQYLFLGIPLTTKGKDKSFYYPIGIIGKKISFALLIQPRSLSTERLKYKIDTINRQRFMEMKSAAKAYSFGS